MKVRNWMLAAVGFVLLAGLVTPANAAGYRHHRHHHHHHHQ